MGPMSAQRRWQDVPRKKTPPPLPVRPATVTEVDGEGNDRISDILGYDLQTWAIHGAPVPRWSHRVAASRVRDRLAMEGSWRSEPLILVGPRVCRAFGLEDYAWLDWFRSSEHGHPLIAWPTSRTFWSGKGRRKETAIHMLVEIAEGRLPHYEKS